MEYPTSLRPEGDGPSASSSPRCLPGSTHGHPREQPVGGLFGVVAVAVFLGVARTAYLNVAVASQAAPVADGVHVHPPGEPGIWRVM